MEDRKKTKLSYFDEFKDDAVKLAESTSRWLVSCGVFERLTFRLAAAEPELTTRAARISELSKYGQRRVRWRQERRG